MENFTGHPSWGDGATKLLGRKIVDVRYLSDDEKELLKWRGRGPVLVLDDGTAVLPAMDNEENDSGTLVVFRDGKISDSLPLSQ